MALIMLLVAAQAVHPSGGMVTHQRWIIDHGLGATKTARVHKTPGGTLEISANRNQLRIESAVRDDGIWLHGWCSIWTHQARDDSTMMWWHGEDNGEENMKRNEMTTEKDR